MINRVVFSVVSYRAGSKDEEHIVQAIVNGEPALMAVFTKRVNAETFAAAMNNAMDLADGHPRRALGAA